MLSQKLLYVFMSYRPLSRNPATTASRTRANVMATATMEAWARSLVAVTAKEKEVGLDTNSTHTKAHLAPVVDAASKRKAGGSHVQVEFVMLCSLSGVLTVRAGLEFKTPAECAIACRGPGSHLQCNISKYITFKANITSYFYIRYSL